MLGLQEEMTTLKVRVKPSEYAWHVCEDQEPLMGFRPTPRT